MNNARYSDKLDIPFDFFSLLPLIYSVFSQKPFFNIYLGESHFKLANLSRINKGRKGVKVFVYKKSVIGSPYSSYAKVSKILNLPRNSIKQFMDTDFEIKGYLVYSSPKLF